MRSDRIGAPPRDTWRERVLELFYPSRCAGCGIRGSMLCERCEPTLPWLPAAICPRCSANSPRGGLCRRCENGGSEQLASVRAACSYEGPVRTAIHQLKFQHGRYVSLLLARLLTRELAKRPIGVDLVVAVPLSQRRQRERGFNQSVLIADTLAKLTALPAPTSEVLKRTRETRPQVGLSASDRRRNVRGAFACVRSEVVTGKRVLLVDDVMTTGATLEDCARALREAGALRVLALVVARDL